MKKILAILWLTAFFLVSCSGTNSADIINPDSDFLYFYWATCPHCQELNRMVEEEDLFSKVSVEKREVFFNNENRELFLATTNALGLNESEVGVPFVLNRKTWEYAIGTQPAYNLFSDTWSTQKDEEEEMTGSWEVDDDMVNQIIDEIVPWEIQEDVVSSGSIVEETNAWAAN